MKPRSRRVDAAERQAISARMKKRFADPQERVRQGERFASRKVLGRCFYCDEPATTKDHVLPRSRGGLDISANIVLACQPCNASKGNRTLTEWLKVLRRQVAEGELATKRIRVFAYNMIRDENIEGMAEEAAAVGG